MKVDELHVKMMDLEKSGLSSGSPKFPRRRFLTIPLVLYHEEYAEYTPVYGLHSRGRCEFMWVLFPCLLVGHTGVSGSRGLDDSGIDI